MGDVDSSLGSPRYCRFCGAALDPAISHECPALAPALAFARYCGTCGAAFDPTAERCPSCGTVWLRPTLSSTYAVAAVLTELQDWYRAGLVDETAFARLHDLYTARLPVEPGTESVRAGVSADGDPLPADTTRRPSRGASLSAWLDRRDNASGAETMLRPSPGVSVAAWAAKRQADIVLYLGAFLLSIAALIFVTYQGQALGAAARIGGLTVYTAGFIAAGLAVRRWERVREAGHVFLALGAVVTPLNFVLLYTEIFRARDVPADLVWLIASAYCLGFYTLLARRGYGAVYGGLAALSLLSGWGALWSALSVPDEWFGAWYMALAVAALAVVGTRPVATGPEPLGMVVARPVARVRNDPLSAALTAIGGLAVLALLAAHAGMWSGSHHEQLPVTYALLTAGIIFAGWRRGNLAALPIAAASGLGVVLATMWAAGVGRQWAAYPVLLLGALAVATRPWWAPRNASLARFGWLYAAVCALSPALFTRVFTGELASHPAHGAVTHAAAAALLGVIAARNTRDGLSAPPAGPRAGVTPLLERAAFGWVAAAFAFAALWYGQRAVGVSRSESVWVWAAIACALALAPVLPRLRGERALGFLTPIALAALALAVQPWDRFAGDNAAALGAAAVAFTITFAVTRRWALSLIAGPLAGAAMAALWNALDAPAWSLALAYGAAAIALFAALARSRTHQLDNERAVAVALLTWAPALAAVGTALVALAVRLSSAGVSVVAVRTAEYYTLAAVVLLIAPLLAIEGRRLGTRLLDIPASAVAMAALLLAIAVARPPNVQAYTAPAAIYLIALGLIVRQSPSLIPPHLLVHELALIAGVLCLTLPQAAQSFDPGGEVWGLALIGEGLLFLAAGFVLRARWLVVAGVLTLSGVAVRWLLTNSATVPYWLWLGVVGLGLLVVGLLILLEHERWERLKLRLSRWWQRAPGVV